MPSAPEHQLSLDADQLRQIPELLPVVAAGQDLLDDVEPAIDRVGLSGTRGELAEQGQKAWQEARIAGAIELLAQQRQSGRDVSALYHDCGVEGPCPQAPQPDRVALGVFVQLGAVTLRGVEIAGPEGDRAGGLSEHAAEGQRVAIGAAFLDVSGGEGLSLIGQALKPQDASPKILRRYSQIEREDLRLLRQHMQ